MVLVANPCRVAVVGWLSCTAAESLRAFVERVFANYRDKNIVFHDCGKTGNLRLSKDLHTQAGWLLCKALPNLTESSVKALRKLYESSPKAGSPKALWWPFIKRVNRDNTKFCDKIAYVGGPSFHRRPWPFVHRWFCSSSTSATLKPCNDVSLYYGVSPCYSFSTKFYPKKSA